MADQIFYITQSLVCMEQMDMLKDGPVAMDGKAVPCTAEHRHVLLTMELQSTAEPIQPRAVLPVDLLADIVRHHQHPHTQPISPLHNKLELQRFKPEAWSTTPYTLTR